MNIKELYDHIISVKEISDTNFQDALYVAISMNLRDISIDNWNENDIDYLYYDAVMIFNDANKNEDDCGFIKKCLVAFLIFTT